jgi:hypothetical protein
MERNFPAAGNQIKNVFGKWKRIATALVLAAGALVCGVLVLGMSFMAASDPIRAKLVASESARLIMAPNTEAAATIAAEPVKVEYYLPYPGILPDNPLYKLKAIRDRLRLWFELDEEKKARLELLYANKRINAAVFLVDGGKGSLGVTTATKAEKYLEQAVERTLKLSKDGKDVKSLMTELMTACRKHAEILTGLQKRAEGEAKKTLELDLAKTELHIQRLEQMLLEVK